MGVSGLHSYCLARPHLAEWKTVTKETYAENQKKSFILVDYQSYTNYILQRVVQIHPGKLIHVSNFNGKIKLKSNMNFIILKTIQINTKRN